MKKLKIIIPIAIIMSICILWFADFTYPLKMHILSIYYTNVYAGEWKLLREYLNTIATGDDEKLKSVLFDETYFIEKHNLLNALRKLFNKININTMRIYLVQNDAQNKQLIYINIFLDNDIKKHLICCLRQRDGKWLLYSISLSDELVHALE